jgi:hypothetical protein
MSSLITSFASIPQVASLNATQGVAAPRGVTRSAESSTVTAPRGDSAEISNSARVRAIFGGDLDYDADDRVLPADSTDVVKGIGAALAPRADLSPPLPAPEPSPERLNRRA